VALENAVVFRRILATIGMSWYVSAPEILVLTPPATRTGIAAVIASSKKSRCCAKEKAIMHYSKLLDPKFTLGVSLCCLFAVALPATLSSACAR
jgi:hypothetical protein